MTQVWVSLGENSANLYMNLSYYPTLPVGGDIFHVQNKIDSSLHLISINVFLFPSLENYFGKKNMFGSKIKQKS